MNVKPIFKSTTGNISELKYVKGIGALFAVTENDVVYRINQFPRDSAGRGLTAVYAQLHNGEGDFSSKTSTRLYYDLYNSIIQLDGETKEFVTAKQDVTAYTVSKNSKVTALYLSDVLKADEDFGFWKTITWKQNVTDGIVVVAMKVAETEEELLDSDWQYYISETPQNTYTSTVGTSHVVLKDLDRFNLKGRYMRFKVELETSSATEIPIVSDFVITYSTKHSVFFFTRKFKVERGSNIDNVLMTATYSTPTNTELRFGVTDSNSGNWEDYRIVNLNELISLPSDWGNIIKIGIKMSSFSEVEFPVVQEIAFLLGTDSDNELN